MRAKKWREKLEFSGEIRESFSEKSNEFTNKKTFTNIKKSLNNFASTTIQKNKNFQCHNPRFETIQKTEVCLVINFERNEI
jgi:hypothetical protein